LIKTWHSLAAGGAIRVPRDHAESGSAFGRRTGHRSRTAAGPHDAPRCRRRPHAIEQRQQSIDIAVAHTQGAVL
jgi:hypothetical protein